MLIEALWVCCLRDIFFSFFGFIGYRIGFEKIKVAKCQHRRLRRILIYAPDHPLGSASHWTSVFDTRRGTGFWQHETLRIAPGLDADGAHRYPDFFGPLLLGRAMVQNDVQKMLAAVVAAVVAEVERRASLAH